MREYLAQNLLHAVVAAGVIEVLLRVWRLAHPSERLAFRLLALTLPLVVQPVGWALAPFRVDPVFADRFALFASAHWSNVRLGGVSVGVLALGAAAAMGVVLYLRDLAPLVRGRRGDRQGVVLAPGDPIARTVARLAARVGLAAPPRVCLVDEAAPVLFASGVIHPTLVVSRGTLDRLDEGPRLAALAHELAHLRRGDLLLGWAVMIARTLMVANPIGQLVARGVIVEIERRADDTAALVLESPAALAEGMMRLVGARIQRGGGDGVRRGVLNGFVLGLAAKGRATALERRLARLGRGWPPGRRPLSPARVGLTSVAVASLLFFVV